MKKPPVIRPGQRTPYVRGTHAEIDQRRGAVLRLLLAGKKRMQIHRYIKDRHARNWRTADLDVSLIVAAARLVTRTRAKHPQTSQDQLIEKLKAECF